MKPKKRQPLSLKGRAIAWLAQREHSRSELRRKLLRLVSAAERASAAAATGAMSQEAAITAASAIEDEEQIVPSAAAALKASPEEVDALLDWLEAHGYLSESRFVEGRLRVRSARYGNLRIHQELARHGVELDADTERTLRVTEFQRAREVWCRKFGDQPPHGASERAKQMRFLAGRGFSADVVRRVVRGTEEDAVDE